MTSTDGSAMYVSVNIIFSNFEQHQQDCLFYNLPNSTWVRSSPVLQVFRSRQWIDKDLYTSTNYPTE